MTIDSKAARAAATRQIRGGPAADDEVFRSWRGASAGDPVLIRDPAGSAAYWLVPVVARGETVGLVRILLDGTPSASIAVKGRAAITSIAEAEACRQGLDVIGARPGAFLGEVLLIHDGAVGREAWRLEVLERGRRTGWVFVTPGGVYERGVNERPPDDARE